ncbi:MAG: glycosyltransferase family 4 protein [Gemmatimonadetes bacterium]|nr:glycosyltransferase family 4 protein [Gemmatimonadota bacterium]
MKVLVTTIYYPPRLGGIENHVYYLCRGLVGRGVETSIVTSRTEPGSLETDEEPLYRVKRVPLPGRNALGWIVNAALSLGPANRWGRDADIIHAHTFQSVLPVLPTKHRRKIPLVVTIHSSHFLKMVPKPHWRFVFKKLLGPADLILATSVELADRCREILPDTRVHEIVNGIDTDLFQPVEPTIARKDDRKILVATRRLVEKNGVRFLIDGMPAILEKTPVDLYLAGIGPEREDLDTRIARYGIGDHVHFLGGVENHKLPGILSSADAVVIPSLMEATSLSALEAMSCERPMAVSRVGGLPEIIDESCGTLFESANPKDLAEKISALLARPEEERAAMGREGRKRVAGKWSVKALVDQHLAYYEELIGKGAA